MACSLIQHLYPLKSFKLNVMILVTSTPKKKTGFIEHNACMALMVHLCSKSSTSSTYNDHSHGSGSIPFWN